MAFKKIVMWIVRIANFVSIACTAIMMVAVVANVVARYVFNSPIAGITELTECCWVLMALSFGYVVLINGHTKVDVFVEKFRPLGRRIMNLITDIIAFAFCGVVAWKTIEKAISSMNSHNMYFMLGVHEWIFIMLFAVSFIVAALAIILLTIEEWKGGKKVLNELAADEVPEEVMKNVH